MGIYKPGFMGSNPLAIEIPALTCCMLDSRADSST